MSTYGTVDCKGISGKTYTFEAYLLNQGFKNVGAVYIITERYVKAGGGYGYKPIYVGMTGDLSARFDDHHKDACFTKNRANFILIHQDGNELSRRAKETDLISNYKPPCNG